MSLEKYESKQVQIRRPAAQIYAMASRFNNFTPILKDRVEEWQATEDTCSFKVKGFTASMRIIDRVEPKLIKIVSGESTPMDFTFWFQLHEVNPTDTRMRMVLHVELNMMMRMMIGGKLQEGLDKMAEQIAAGLNGVPF